MHCYGCAGKQGDVLPYFLVSPLNVRESTVVDSAGCEGSWGGGAFQDDLLKGLTTFALELYLVASFR